jgi:FkbM family methyltransferase
VIVPANIHGAPFDCVLDVGGNVGAFAELAVSAWPDASVCSFEPLPNIAQANRERSAGRWRTYEVAISEHPDTAPLRYCVNQHSASTMQAPGPARGLHFGIRDEFHTLTVETMPLDRFCPGDECERLLVKIDVEGHELHVLRGARRTLAKATTVICEVQQDATIFLGSPSPWMVDHELRRYGLQFVGLVDAFKSPRGDVLQFDGVWTRDFAPWREPPEQTDERASWPNALPPVQQPSS